MRLHSAVIVVIALAACAPRASLQPTATTDALVRVFDSKANRFTDFDAMTRQLARADIVFFGEQHDDPDTHAAELAVLAAVGAASRPTVLSLEMFERDVQPLLARYLAGEVAESVFVADSRPWDRYRTDYRGIVELARIRGWPVVAANIPRRLASGISRRGLAHLDTLSPIDRAFAAREHQCNAVAGNPYFQRFSETMQGHGAGAPAASDSAAMRLMTLRFYDSQCAKDEAMAEAITSAYRGAGPGTLLMHVNGSFHSDFGLGTAERVRRRLPNARIALVTAIPLARGAAPSVATDSQRADFLLYTRARQ